MKKILTSSLLATAMVATSYSQAVIYESFSQEVGSLGGASGGTGLNSWTIDQTVNVETQSLNYGNLQNQGNQIRLVNNSGVDAYATTTSALADANLLQDGAELWFSYVYTKFAGNGSNEKSGFAFGTDNLAGAFNGTNMTNGGNGLGIWKNNLGIQAAGWSGGGDAIQGGSNLSLTNYGDSIFLVGKITWGATALDDETITIYSPDQADAANFDPNTATSDTKTIAGVDQTLFDTISMTLRNANGDQLYDEIRFGASYDDVSPVPEPGSFAPIGGCLALTSVMLRRRRS